jgi:hypothetical protein
MCPQIDLDMLAALSLLQTKISVNPIRLTMFEHCLVSIAYCTACATGTGVGSPETEILRDAFPDV